MIGWLAVVTSARGKPHAGASVVVVRKSPARVVAGGADVPTTQTTCRAPFRSGASGFGSPSRSVRRCSRAKADRSGQPGLGRSGDGAATAPIRQCRRAVAAVIARRVLATGVQCNQAHDRRDTRWPGRLGLLPTCSSSPGFPSDDGTTSPAARRASSSSAAARCLWATPSGRQRFCCHLRCSGWGRAGSGVGRRGCRCWRRRSGSVCSSGAGGRPISSGRRTSGLGFTRGRLRTRRRSCPDGAIICRPTRCILCCRSS